MLSIYNILRKDKIMHPTVIDEFSCNDNSEANLRDDLEEAIDHGILVSKLSYFLAKQMELEEGYCYSMAEAGLIHDIGKLRLGRFLYGRNKNALVVEEMKYIRMHSSIGYEILLEYGYSEEICKAVTVQVIRIILKAKVFLLVPES